MKIETDWHIHSHNSFDEASMTIKDIIASVRKNRIRKFGVSDHLNTRINLPDIEASRREYLENQTEGFHFGIEVSCVSLW
ncbi:MAG: PHP domain-containing protein, partial [Candidatus Ratteibacteria bacterium]